MEWHTDRELRARMVAVLGLLVALSLGFVVALHWAFTDALSAFLTFATRLAEAEDQGLALDRAPEMSVVVGDRLGALLVGVVLVGIATELRSNPATAESSGTRRTGDDVPDDLRRRLARLAQTADVTPPDVAVLDDETPRAYATGVRQGSATVVVSTGLLAVLSEEELDAVLAHELAHVKNRDAGVMTLASLPRRVGAWLLDRGDAAGPTGDRERDSSGAWLFYVAVVRPVAWASWWVGRGLTRLLSQYREFAADSGAAAITGSPAAVASALATLDRAARERPVTDVRAGDRAMLAFNVIPVPAGDDGFDPDDYTGFAVNDVDGGIVGEVDDATSDVNEVTDLPTHPPTSERIDRLRRLEPET